MLISGWEQEGVDGGNHESPMTFAAGQRSEIGRFEVPKEEPLPGFGIGMRRESLEPQCIAEVVEYSGLKPFWCGAGMSYLLIVSRIRDSSEMEAIGSCLGGVLVRFWYRDN